jgi:hypothetical protein
MTLSAESLRTSWQASNQRSLMAKVDAIAELLRGLAGLGGGQDPDPGSAPARRRNGTNPVTAPGSMEPHPPDTEACLPAAIDVLTRSFGLSPFEERIVVICAGLELDARIGPLCAAAAADPARPYPTFGLALAALPGAHWSALVPGGPLRRWRLVEVDLSRGLTTGRLSIDERVLHYLTGVEQLDERLSEVLIAVRAGDILPPSQHAAAEAAAGAWTRALEERGGSLIQLCGEDPAANIAVAAEAAAVLGVVLYRLEPERLPASPADAETLARLWEREAALSGAALLIEGESLDRGEASWIAAVASLADRIATPVMVAGREQRQLGHRAGATIDVPAPTMAEQIALWRDALGTAAPVDNELDRLVGQFSMTPASIRAIVADATAGGAEAHSGALHDALWWGCRAHARPAVEALAQRIDPAASWDDLVLPAAHRQTLLDIAANARQRAKVYEGWGFGRSGARGLGISVLFAGASGTGKTLAAEVLAHDLGVDLYRIDLSQVVSKYIGETEKNLRRVFSAAEHGGCALLFDEADAIFGKRSEVKDSHDRYANIEVSYLLQRMESYRGIAILTTNHRSALDPAFLRRLRFVIEFPFPDEAQRRAIWQRVFPPATPLHALDWDQLAKLNVPGGVIRNIAILGAFLAADAGEAVGMRHLLRAAQTEYAKLERPLTQAEVAGWP